MHPLRSRVLELLLVQLLVLAAACLVAASAWAQPSPCTEAIRTAERAAGVPTTLLHAIGVVESGRPDPVSRLVAPWPWTINVEGTGHFFASRDEAVSAVVLARAEGRRSIDVGCMQVNLMHHPQAFASLEEAFEPQANATYAARFLTRLRVQTGDWAAAAAAYHSQTPGVADEYRRRVVAGWTGAASFGATAPARPRRNEPAGGYTPEFRARLAQDAADRRTLLAAMGMERPSRPGPRPMLQASLHD